MKKTFLILLIIISILLAGCSSNYNNQKEIEDKVSVAKITPEEAKTRLESNNSIIIVDVRTPDEYNEEHIKGAILLPLDDISEEASTIIPDKEATYYIYCRSGNRSATAAAQLVKMGYENIYDLGGINNWPYEKQSN